jgi:thioredoxin reductase
VVRATQKQKAICMNSSPDAQPDAALQQGDLLDVVIVGAGPAGLGCAIALGRAGVSNLTVLERHEVGASFKRWPREMRFITPSFNSGAFGLVDLNAITPDTSPAWTLGKERLSGPDYARYLEAIARHFEVPVDDGTEVTGVERVVNPFARDEIEEHAGLLEIVTNKGCVYARNVIWAAGEFQYPRQSPFPGAEHCIHNALVTTWTAIEGDSCLVIGGYESGVDAAVSLVNLGKTVTVLDDHDAWADERVDPSFSLSPYTQERLRRAKRTGRLTLVGNARVEQVELGGIGFVARTAEGDTFESPTPPILAAGFIGSFALLHDKIELREDGYPLLTERDESTITPGLFFSGPFVRHDKAVLCFIYKYRQRFAVIAETIAQRLGLSADGLEVYRQHHMFLTDFSCCGESCVC